MGQKYEASLAFLVGNGGSLLDLASLTLHYKSIKQTPIQFTFQTNNHSNKFTPTRQWKPIYAWEHAQDSFILQRGLYGVSKLCKIQIGHFTKVAKSLARGFCPKTILNPF